MLKRKKSSIWFVPLNNRARVCVMHKAFCCDWGASTTKDEDDDDGKW